MLLKSDNLNWDPQNPVEKPKAMAHVYNPSETGRNRRFPGSAQASLSVVSNTATEQTASNRRFVGYDGPCLSS